MRAKLRALPGSISYSRKPEARDLRSLLGDPAHASGFRLNQNHRADGKIDHSSHC
jgi:hypothetical protein